MKFRILSLVLAVLCMLALVSCGEGNITSNNSDVGYLQTTSNSNLTTEPEIVETYYNNLTGCEVVGSKDKENLRPVAVMVNNLGKAQKVQTGLKDASIVYETFVEGGITRLLAVYKDVSAVGEIGTVRSARYSYVDLANGHDALYFHCGLDPDYCKTYMNQLKLDDIDINTGVFEDYGYRVNNGLSREHTMYTTGELVAKSLSENNRRTEKNDKRAKLYEPWQKFAAEGETVTLSGGSANNITSFFSSSYVTKFAYDAESGMYVKSNKSGNNTDYRTGETMSYKNVLILFTAVGNFSDNYRVYSKLESGTGYYCTNGTYVKVKWSKGDTYNPLKITDENGQPVEYSAGNSYVCITSNNVKDKCSVS